MLYGLELEIGWVVLGYVRNCIAIDAGLWKMSKLFDLVY